jgi:hypothetical protein
MMLEGTPFLTLRGGVLYLHGCQLDRTTQTITYVWVRNMQ